MNVMREAIEAVAERKNKHYKFHWNWDHYECPYDCAWFGGEKATPSPSQSEPTNGEEDSK